MSKDKDGGFIPLDTDVRQNEDIKYLKYVLTKCEEINKDEVRAIFHSSYPVDFLDAFILALKDEIERREA